MYLVFPLLLRTNTMSNNVTFVPSSAVSSPGSIYQSLTLTLPQEPITAPVLVPSPCAQTNPVTKYTMHTEDHICRIRNYRILLMGAVGI